MNIKQRLLQAAAEMRAFTRSAPANKVAKWADVMTEAVGALDATIDAERSIDGRLEAARAAAKVAGSMQAMDDALKVLEAEGFSEAYFALKVKVDACELPSDLPDDWDRGEF